ncbi:MAG TPA: glycosyltransferase family 2 protein, partial [Acidimicrobiia bacterium]|nr:glycosyltransferase family 2 protein [Acidimicrobiia bacterium]
LGGDARMVSGRTTPPPGQLALATRPFSRVLCVEDVAFFETCNAFYRRSDLESVGGFDERFGFGGEDTDLGLRMVRTGVTPVFAPDALVHHDVHPGTLVDALHDAARFVDLPLVVREHPEIRTSLVHRRLFWKRTHPPAIAAAVGLLVSARWPVTLVLVVPWLHHRLRVTPACPGPGRRVVALPGTLLVDLCEVGVMVRGSIRHRTVLL